MKGSTKKAEDAPQKLVARIEYEHKIHKVKKITLPVPPKTYHAPTVAPPVVVTSTFDEAKACCKARKRKERQESASSLCQERKVIRSNSEERPLRNKTIELNSTIRRVSSSGDFPKDNQKSTSLEKLSGSPQKMASTDKLLTYDDHENEKRRSHERFARPHSQGKSRIPGKRLRVRYNTKIKDKDNGKKNGNSGADGSYPYSFLNPIESSTEGDSPEHKSPIQLKEKEKVMATSPLDTPISPILDFSALLDQVENSEPLLSNSNPFITEDTETMPSLSVATNRSMLSPRNSIIATHKIYLDPDVPQANREKIIKDPIDGRMHKLNKQINSQKKKIKNCEAEFETKRGFKPSQIDKFNDTIIRKLYAELSKLKKEQKQLSDISASCSLIDFSGTLIQHGKLVSLQETVNEIDQKLAQKRELGNRSLNLEEMNPTQLAEEKLAMQKALLYLESVHGRPQTREDRDFVRPFYDRYRTLKRMVLKISTAGLNNELATIHENETMNFVTPTSSSNDTESERTDSTKPIPIPKPSNVPLTDSDSESSSCSENYHSLSKDELNRQIKIITEEKKELRRTIKEFEINVQSKTTRMLSKEDKEPMESVYSAYKQAKGKLRLLEALLGKK